MPYGQPYMMMPGQRPTSSGLSIAGFVLALVGLLLYGLPSIVGLILSIVGLNQVKASNGAKTGGGLAIAGIIISCIAILLWAFIIVVAVIFVSNHPHHYE